MMTNDKNIEMDADFNASLVKEVKKRPLLYKSGICGHSAVTQSDKLEAWQDVADKLHVNVHVVKRRFRALRDRYVKEKHNGPVAKKPWPLFNEFDEFLANYISSRRYRYTDQPSASPPKSSKEKVNQSRAEEKNAEVIDIKCESSSWENDEDEEEPQELPPPPIATTSQNPIQTSFVTESSYFDSQDEDSLFVLSILPAIKRMPRNLKNRAKLEIQKIICEYDVDN